MSIPDFLRPDNTKHDKKDDEMIKVIRKYKETIGDDLMTEPSSFTEQEWVDMLNECIEKNLTIWELLSEKYDPDAC